MAVNVLYLFVNVPRGGLWYVIVALMVILTCLLL